MYISNENINFLKSGFYFLIVKNEDTGEEIIKKNLLFMKILLKLKQDAKEQLTLKI